MLTSFYALLNWGLNLDIDFRGGVILEVVDDNGNTILVEEDSSEIGKVESLRLEYKEKGYDEIRFESVGPTIAPDTIKKTYYAVIISTVLILGWITIQFRSYKFGISAVIAMAHDALILIGSFALFGHLFGVQVDFLFVTALLTILSFSVHDTIVVFDRIREKTKNEEIGDIKSVANSSITETMVRSLNNSFTIIFMLIALVLLGGETIRWFALALLIGTVLGTYSSPFVAVPLLVVWDKIIGKLKK